MRKIVVFLFVFFFLIVSTLSVKAAVKFYKPPSLTDIYSLEVKNHSLLLTSKEKEYLRFEPIGIKQGNRIKLKDTISQGTKLDYSIRNLKKKYEFGLNITLPRSTKLDKVGFLLESEYFNLSQAIWNETTHCLTLENLLINFSDLVESGFSISFSNNSLLVNNPGKGSTINLDPTIEFSSSTLLSLDISALTNTSFVIAYVDDTNDAVYYKTYYTNGTLIYSSSSIDSYFEAEEGHRIGVDAFNSSEFVITYEKKDSPYAGISRKIKSFDNNSLKIEETLDAAYGAGDIVIFDDSSFVTSWVKDYFGDIYFQSFDNEGNTLSSRITVDNNMGDIYNYFIGMDIFNDNEFVIAYKDKRYNRFEAAIYEKDGSVVTPVFTVATGYDYFRYGTDVGVFDNDTYVITYYDNSLKFSIYTRPNTKDTTVTFESNPSSSGANALGIINSSAFVVTWVDSSNNLKFAVYDKEGNTITSPVTFGKGDFVAVTTRRMARNFGICNNTFVIAWINDTGGYWQGFYVNGSEWDGSCNVNVGNIYSYNLSQDLSFSSSTSNKNTFSRQNKITLNTQSSFYKNLFLTKNFNTPFDLISSNTNTNLFGRTPFLSSSFNQNLYLISYFNRLKSLGFNLNLLNLRNAFLSSSPTQTIELTLSKSRNTFSNRNPLLDFTMLTNSFKNFFNAFFPQQSFTLNNFITKSSLSTRNNGLPFTISTNPNPLFLFKKLLSQQNTFNLEMSNRGIFSREVSTNPLISSFNQRFLLAHKSLENQLNIIQTNNQQYFFVRTNIISPQFNIPLFERVFYNKNLNEGIEVVLSQFKGRIYNRINYITTTLSPVTNEVYFYSRQIHDFINKGFIVKTNYFFNKRVGSLISYSTQTFKNLIHQIQATQGVSFYTLATSHFHNAALRVRNILLTLSPSVNTLRSAFLFKNPSLTINPQDSFLGFYTCQIGFCSVTTIESEATGGGGGLGSSFLSEGRRINLILKKSPLKLLDYFSSKIYPNNPVIGFILLIIVILLVETFTLERTVVNLKKEYYEEVEEPNRIFIPMLVVGLVYFSLIFAGGLWASGLSVNQPLQVVDYVSSKIFPQDPLVGFIFILLILLLIETFTLEFTVTKFKKGDYYD